MKKNYRRALLFVAILVFVAVTPLVILYALGYQTGLTAVDPIPVGVLLIETEPAGARAYVNERYVGDTPYSLSNLPAGPIIVKITKEGYAPWEKQLRISPGRATEIRDIRLFPTDRHPLSVASKVRSFALSPNRRLLGVVHVNNTLTIHDQSGEVVVPAQTFRSPIVALVWSPHSDALLVQTAGPTSFWYLSIAAKAAPQPLAALDNAASLMWDPRLPGRVLYTDRTQTLQAYTIESAAHATLVSNVQKFAVSANRIYVWPTAGEALAEYTLPGKRTSAAFPPLPGTPRELLVTPQKNIAVSTQAGEVWVLTDAGQWQPVASGIQTMAWSPSGKVLLLTADDSSLYVFNVNDKRTTLPVGKLRLVQRLSRPIVDPQWFAGSRHVIYQVDDEVWITEIDTRDHPISYQVDTTNTGAALAAVGEEGETLFYLKKTARDTTLVAEPLLVP